MNKILLGLFLSMSVLSSASFDCNKATSKIEKAICTNSELSTLDEKLAKRYIDIRNSISNKLQPSLKEEQIDWIKDRNKNCNLLETKELVGYIKSSIEARLEYFETYDIWSTNYLNIDPWLYTDKGRYNQGAIRATSTKVGHKALEVATLSLDCLKGQIIPSLSYSFSAEYGLENTEYWDKIDSSAIIKIGSQSFDFLRTTYSIGNHPYMLSSDDTKERFITTLIKPNADIHMFIRVKSDGSVRKIKISNANISSLYKNILLTCNK